MHSRWEDLTFDREEVLATFPTPAPPGLAQRSSSRRRARLWRKTPDWPWLVEMRQLVRDQGLRPFTAAGRIAQMMMAEKPRLALSKEAAQHRLKRKYRKLRDEGHLDELDKFGQSKKVQGPGLL